MRITEDTEEEADVAEDVVVTTDTLTDGWIINAFWRPFSLFLGVLVEFSVTTFTFEKVSYLQGISSKYLCMSAIKSVNCIHPVLLCVNKAPWKTAEAAKDSNDFFGVSRSLQSFV